MVPALCHWELLASFFALSQVLFVVETLQYPFFLLQLSSQYLDSLSFFFFALFLKHFSCLLNTQEP